MEQNNTLPSYLLERLAASYSAEQTARILAGYAAQRTVTFRVNPLKADVTGCVGTASDSRHYGHTNCLERYGILLCCRCTGSTAASFAVLCGRGNLFAKSFFHATACGSSATAKTGNSGHDGCSRWENDANGSHDAESGEYYGVRAAPDAGRKIEV